MIESDPLSDGSFAQMPPWEAWAKAVPAFSQQNINEDLQAFAIFTVTPGGPTPMHCLIRAVKGISDMEEIAAYAGALLMGEYIKNPNQYLICGIIMGYIEPSITRDYHFCCGKCLMAWLGKKLYGDCKHGMVAHDADGPYCEKCGARLLERSKE